MSLLDLITYNLNLDVLIDSVRALNSKTINVLIHDKSYYKRRATYRYGITFDEYDSRYNSEWVRNYAPYNINGSFEKYSRWYTHEAIDYLMVLALPEQYIDEWPMSGQTVHILSQNSWKQAINYWYCF